MTTTETVAAACAVVKVWCETCEGTGTIDETLGGIATSNPEAECPDCGGLGYWESRIESALASAEPVAYTDPENLADGSDPGSWEMYKPGDQSRGDIALYTHAKPAAKVEALKWAQGLIEQLPANHDGRNSWLVNHGVGDESDWLRAEWKRYADECHDYYCSGPMDGPKPERRRYPVSASPAIVPDGWGIRRDRYVSGIMHIRTPDNRICTVAAGDDGRNKILFELAQSLIETSPTTPQPPKDAYRLPNESPGDSLSLHGAAGRSASRPDMDAGANNLDEEHSRVRIDSVLACYDHGSENGKDAGAVPLPKMVGMISDRPICFQDEVARYGNAREAAARDDAGRADAVPDVSEDDAAIANEVRAMQGALRNTDKPASYAAALFLACNAAKCNAGTLAVELTGVTDGDAEKGDWTVTVTRSNPSPAHAGAGDEALALRLDRMADDNDTVGFNCEAECLRSAAHLVRREARRLAGGDHA